MARENIRRIRNRRFCAAILILAALSVGLDTAQAQAIRLGVSSDASEVETTFAIAPGSLASAVLQFGQQSGLQIVMPGQLTQGLHSAGLQGRYTAADALSALLEETSLRFRFIGGTVQIYDPEAQNTSGGRVLGSVRVEGLIGTAGNGQRQGGNGSRDVTATEGSGSLNGARLTLGGKSPGSIKETPQAVSVITQERMKQQNIDSLTDVMRQATGITVKQKSSYQTEFYSRAYQIQSFQIDGGSSFTTNGLHDLTPNFDMSMYDHIELLRGSDGLFSGYGVSPGGTINLVRKKPLDHNQLSLETQAGSWDHYHTSLDVTGPLGFDGRLRGRGVLTWSKQNEFYDVVDDGKRLAYGTLEADLSDSTLLRVGGSYTRQRSTAWDGGLMTYADGSEVGFSRSTSFTYDWNHYDTDTREWFATLEQQLGESWSTDLKYTRLDQKYDVLTTYLADALPLQGDDELPLYGSANQWDGIQDSLDWNLNGHIEVFGLPQKLLVGGNWSHSSVDGDDYYSLFPIANPEVPVLPKFDHHLPKPTLPEPDQGSSEAKQWGLYSRVEITPWKPLHLIYGWRLNGYRYDTPGYATLSEKSTQKPYYAAIVDITPELSVYASYTDIYEPQLNYLGLNGQPIDPITGNTIEGGIKFADSSGQLNASLSFYRIEYIDEPYRVCQPGEGPDCFPVYFSDGKSGYYDNWGEKNISQGVDLEITGRLTDFWQVSLGYTYNQNEQGQPVPDLIYSNSKGKPIRSFVPRHTLKLWNSFQLHGNPWLERTELGLGVTVQSRGYTAGYVCDDASLPDSCNKDVVLNKSHKFLNPGRAVFSGRLAYQLNDNWNLALNVDNLFDRRYYETVGDATGGHWYGAPRNFMLSLVGHFE